MALDLFSIAKGLKAGTDAYQRGQKQQADQYWSELENSLKTMASAQGIRQSAELHPLEMQIKQAEVPYRQAVTRTANVEAQTAEQRLTDEQAKRGFIEQQGKPYAQMEAERYMSGAEQEKATSELATAEAREKLPYVQLLTQLGVDNARIELLTNRANIGLLKAKAYDLYNSGKSANFNEALKSAAYSLIAEQQGISVPQVEANRITGEWQREANADKRAMGAESRAITNFNERDLPAAITDVDSYIRDMNEIIYSVKSGNPMDLAIAEKIAGRPIAAGEANNPELKNQVLRSIGRGIQSRASAFPNSPIIQDALRNFIQTTKMSPIPKGTMTPVPQQKGIAPTGQGIQTQPRPTTQPNRPTGTGTLTEEQKRKLLDKFAEGR